MLAVPQPASAVPAPVLRAVHVRSEEEEDPFVLYTQSLYDYTLRLWTESRRVAEEKAHIRATDLATLKLQDERKKAAEAPRQ